MAIKHSTVHAPNEIVPSADWNANHTIDSDVPFNNNKATGVKDPTLAQDAATKKYVDDLVPGVRTSYLSINPTDFSTNYPQTHNITKSVEHIRANADGISFVVPVKLPHGAIITKAIVYGNAAATDETWVLVRVDYAGNIGSVASAKIGTEDITISNATIDNENYSYGIYTGTLDTNDEIWGARITYTL